MGNPKAAESAAVLRMLPATDDVLTSPTAARLIPEVGRVRLASFARNAIQELRAELMNDTTRITGRAEVYSKGSLLTAASEKLETMWKVRRASRLRRVINATGVVIHTNLGRAPLSADAIKAIQDCAGYCTLEYEIGAGKRGRRGGYAEDLLTELTGAEAALVVNNCAAAAFIVLSVFANGGETIVSRGELVEIGGDFRIPDVLAQSGATLKEVGTTNRTKLSDYEKAIGENTRVVMRVHPSNYRIVGFTATPSLAQLAELSHRTNVLLYEDAGSGALLDLAVYGLRDEPVISRSIADGADIVTFSGDKLLGGTQAGIIVGRRDLIERIRKHPLYRALRVDKLIYGALEATLETYMREDAEKLVPVLRMLGTPKEEIEVRARRLIERLDGAAGKEHAFVLDVIPGESVIGGGSGPDVRLDTALLAIDHPTRSCAEIEASLRNGETPIIVRIENDKVLLDLRTVEMDEEDRLTEMLAAAIA